MKQADVKIGGRYEAKVSGKLTTVEVTSEFKGYANRVWFGCVNVNTGRTCRMTAAKLRREAL